MKTPILLIVLFLSLLAVNGETAHAQKTTSLNSTPKAFQTFYAKFKNAVVKGDKKAVASLTHFPFEFEYVEERDQGTLSEAQFVKKFNDILGGERKIFRQKNPVFYSQADGYNLTDEWDASVFVFEKKGTSYKFAGYIALP